MKQPAADERVILVWADALTPQLFNTTTEAHSLTDIFDRSTFNSFHDLQRLSNIILSGWKSSKYLPEQALENYNWSYLALMQRNNPKAPPRAQESRPSHVIDFFISEIQET